ncbi:KxYKxGKxW signal peptide domain-containing protein [Pediococcus damnosus]|uniref:KxYKxGKxW signal peptide domain-containing protein n=1 Tax=Pediococcus damnosus TaxID=51663 RepID=UPI0007A0A1D6|nr:KxYKxGKxW signal peptide domain-containing protein [Pediococcus damnosus]
MGKNNILGRAKKIDEHYKMYKDGKRWMFAGMAMLSLGIGMATQVNDAHADTVVPTANVATTSSASKSSAASSTASSSASVSSASNSSVTSNSVNSSSASVGSASKSGATSSATSSSASVSSASNSSVTSSTVSSSTSVSSVSKSGATSSTATSNVTPNVKVPSSVTSISDATSSATVTNLVDPTNADIAAAKSAALIAYETTGKPQMITAAAAASVTAFTSTKTTVDTNPSTETDVSKTNPTKVTEDTGQGEQGTDALQAGSGAPTSTNMNVVVGSTIGVSGTVAGDQKTYLQVEVPDGLKVNTNGNATVYTTISIPADDLSILTGLIEGIGTALSNGAKLVDAIPGVNFNAQGVVDAFDVSTLISKLGTGVFSAPVTQSADGKYMYVDITGDTGISNILTQDITQTITNLTNAVSAIHVTATVLGFTTDVSGTAASDIMSFLTPAINALKASITTGGSFINKIGSATLVGQIQTTVPVTAVTPTVTGATGSYTLEAQYVNDNTLEADIADLGNNTAKAVLTYKNTPVVSVSKVAGDSKSGYQITGTTTGGGAAARGVTVTVTDSAGNVVGTGVSDANGNTQSELMAALGLKVL